MTSFYREAQLASRTEHWRDWHGIRVRDRKASIIQVGRWFVLGHCVQIRFSARMHCIPSSPDSDAGVSTR